jgi:phosphatidylserine/phosphatidylglycerophosphate/cardiolipin synthase-like enzyme
MRASLTKNGVTLRVVAGTRCTILGMDLQASKRAGCLGFSIRKVDLGTKAAPLAQPVERWLPNMLSFPSAKATKGEPNTLDSPLQKFRWGDYECEPGHRYRYQVVPRYGAPGALLPKRIGDDDGVTVEVQTEDPQAAETQVFFNRAAAASRAFGREFPSIKSEKTLLSDAAEAVRAKQWLSRGLEEALLAFIARAEGPGFALHGAIYEFQKDTFLNALKAALDRGVDVQVVYHARGADKTTEANEKAIKRAKLPARAVHARRAAPDSAIMHNKFLVLSRTKRGKSVPESVWTGSTNWTDGGIYGQLNVGHAVNDAATAATYERCFEILRGDQGAADTKHAIGALTPVSLLLPPGHGVTPVFSPQSNETMLHLYSTICANARCVMICAPFALSPIILNAFTSKSGDARLRYFLLDKEGSLGKGQEVRVIENDPESAIGVAVTLKSPLHDFQGRLLEGKESFRHAGIHIHSKIILADPFGSDPTLVMGSANFSHNSTEVNDSNSLIFRGDTAIADIYATEFMRMFEHYHFRASEAESLTQKKKTPRKKGARAKAGDALALHEDDSWSDRYWVSGSADELDRRMFSGNHG